MNNLSGNQTNTQGEPFTSSTPAITYWYQEPWAWFIAGIIAITVTWGTFVVGLSLYNADEVVVDDYYKVGKAINLDLRRDRRAVEQQLTAAIHIDDSSGALKVKMTGVVESWPTQLRLRLMPVARNVAKEDIILIRTSQPTAMYTGRSQNVPSGRYYVQLETLDQLTPEQGYLSGWRINRQITFTADSPVQLTAIQ